MPTEQDVKFSDFIRGLPAATEDDLSAGNKMPLVRSGDVKGLPGEAVAKASAVSSGLLNIEQNNYPSYKGIPRSSATNWYVDNACRHIAIRLIPGEKYTIKSNINANFVFVTDAYEPKDQTNLADLHVAPRNRWRKTTKANEIISFVARSDEAYLILVVVDGGGNSVTWDIKKQLNTNLVSAIESTKEDLIVGKLKYSDTDFFKYDGSLTTSGTWYADVGSSHIHFPLVVGTCVSIKPIMDIPEIRIGVVSSLEQECDKVSGQVVNYLPGTSFFNVKAGEIYKYLPTENGSALILTVVSGLGNPVAWEIVVENSSAFSVDDENVIEVASMTKYQGTASGSNTWYTYQAKHVAIPMAAGKSYKFSPINIDANYFVVNSSYTPGNQTSGVAVPYSSRIKTRGFVSKGCEIAMTTQDDDAYLILIVVDGGGNSVTWKASEYIGRDESVKRLKYSHWNIGHFSMGKNTSTTITAAEKAEKIVAFRNLFNSLGADVLGIAEDNFEFSVDGARSFESIYRCFKNGSFGDKLGFNANSIYHNFKTPINDNYYFFEEHSQDRYIHELEFVWNGEKVIVAETHLDLTEALIDTQIQAIIERYANQKYVIISGDWNVRSDTQFEALTGAGFNLALCDYMPGYDTYAGNDVTPGHAGTLDNIAVKGFAIGNVKVADESANLSDHKLVSCELTMV